jgi:hypothetical protein
MRERELTRAKLMPTSSGDSFESSRTPEVRRVHRGVQCFFRAVFVFSTTLLFVSPAASQIVRGTVVEDGADSLIDGVLVILLSAAGDSVASTVSVDGAFTLVAPRPGRYRLKAERLGYVAIESGTIEVQPGLETVVSLALGTQAVSLEPLRVVGRRMPLQAEFADIDERMRQGFGRFITRDEIDRQPGAKVPDLLRSVPGARVSATRFGDLVLQLRARGSLREVHDDGSRVGAYRFANGCPVKLYVDGIPWVRPQQVHPGDGVPQGLDGPPGDAMHRNREFMEIHGDEIEVIEVYTPASTPGIYGGSDAECGVVAVWRRRTYEQVLFHPFRRLPPVGSDVRVPDVELVVSAYHITGPHAPGTGAAIGAGVYWTTLLDRVGVGLFLRLSMHQLSGWNTDELTETLSTTQYVLPPGRRGLALWVAGIEPQLELGYVGRVRLALGGRVQGAHRGFTLRSPNVGNRAVPVTSYGWGIGVTATAALPLTDGLTALGTMGRDWLFFAAYREIERPWNRTASTWRGAALHLGLQYDFKR